jgi:biotin carboxylase
MEVNPRVQVEIGVSGRVAAVKDGPPGMCLVQEQIRLALGEQLGYRQQDATQTGAAIEFRIVAEDTRRGFTAWSGAIETFRLPEYDWATCYSHVPSDRPYVIPTEYDPNLALAIIWGQDLRQAKERGFQFLSEVVIEGRDVHGEAIETNLEFLRDSILQVLRYS